MPDRPVRLTFPSADSGWAAILADGLRVGHARHDLCWRAFLWNEAGNRDGGYADAPVTARTLGELRDVLRERVERDGPWWKEAG